MELATAGQPANHSRLVHQLSRHLLSAFRQAHTAQRGVPVVALKSGLEVSSPETRALQSILATSRTPARSKSRMACRVAAEAMPEVLTSQDMASSLGWDLSVKFDNEADDEATVVTIQGQDQADLLMSLTGAFHALDVVVHSARIDSQPGGEFRDVFHISTKSNEKIPESSWADMKGRLYAMVSESSRSSKPAIYGAPSTTEPPRLRPVRREGETRDLEKAAGEMASAASRLVEMERNIVSMTQDGASQQELAAKESERAEAASLLERRMTQMEAILAARRAVQQEPTAQTETEAAREGGGEMRFQQGGASSTGPAAGDGFEIILQGFNWESCKGVNGQPFWQVLQGQAQAIAEAGFTSVWMPPPSDAVSDQGYLPRDLYNLDSKYGSQAELRNCISVIHENNLKAIADIVINHRCAHAQEDGKWNKFGGRLPWDKSYICSDNPDYGGTGGRKTGEDYHAAPNIDHNQERVRKDIIAWMKMLRGIGFDAWRFDFVKGYGGKFIQEYVNATVPYMAFGEFWDTCEYTDGVLNYNQDGHRQRTVNWCDATGGTSAAFDFTTKGILQEAMGRGEYWRLVDPQGRPPGFLGMWPSRAITFIENHDTGSTLNHWPFPWNHVHEGYAYILTHPGSPCVFYDHFWDNSLGKTIRDCISLRKRHKIGCRAKVIVHKAAADLYAASIDKKIAMKVGYGNWSPTDDNCQVGQRDWVLATSGPNFAIWEAIF